MNNEEIIRSAAYRLGKEKTHKLLMECCISLCSALLQREHSMADESPDPDLCDSLDFAVNGRVADMLVGIDMVAIFGRRKDIKAEITKRIVRLDVQNMEAELP